MKKLNNIEARTINGGKTYRCPWGDYSNTNYWKTYGHAIVCAAKHGVFDLPLWMIKTGLGL